MANLTIPVGNDFDLRFVVTSPTYTADDIVFEDFDITTCTDVRVMLECERHNILIPLEWELELGSDNVIIAHVIGNQLEVGSTYGCVIDGKDANDKAFRWACDSEQFFSVVDDTNAQNLSDSTFDVDVKIGLVSPQGPQGAQGATGQQGTNGIGFRLGENNQFYVDNHIHVTHGDGIFFEDEEHGMQGTSVIINKEGKGIVEANDFMFNEYNGIRYKQLKPIIDELYELLAEGGPQGDKGAKGDQGVAGQQGQKGAQGEKGDKGAQGDKGDKGADGVQGSKGQDGVIGRDGAQGAKGDQGIAGQQGDKGDKGQDGTVSFDELTPEQIEMLRGYQGVKGNQGNQGIQGEQGIQGSQGEIGEQGALGNQGEKGDQGTQGNEGIQGSQGTQGNEGIQGSQGIQGEQGIQGSQGNEGIQGSLGNQGTQGTQGSQGNKGVQGTQGNMGWQGVGIEMMLCTQASYDSLPTKYANVLYIIRN